MVHGEEDNVCGIITQCTSDEYMVSDFVHGATSEEQQDRVCKIRSTCLSTEFLLRMGSNGLDNICETVTGCTVIGLYEYKSAIDATSDTVNGSNTDCRSYTTCPVAQFIDFDVSDNSEVMCTVCPIGTYGTDGIECVLCGSGTYNTNVGQSTCVDCNQCTEEQDTTPELSCPTGEDCTISIYSVCGPTTNSVCMQCPSSWNLDIVTGKCSACIRGYYYDNMAGIETLRCKECSANYYCSSKHSYRMCQGMFRV